MLGNDDPVEIQSCTWPRTLFLHFELASKTLNLKSDHMINQKKN